MELGDKVIVYPWLGCGVCPVCEAGNDHLCPRASRNLGIQLPGGYADLVRVPHARYLVPIGSSSRRAPPPSPAPASPPTARSTSSTR